MVSREELHQLAWAKPITKVAEPDTASATSACGSPSSSIPMRHNSGWSRGKTAPRYFERALTDTSPSGQPAKLPEATQ
jgi:Mn-containing catalase